MAVFSLGTSTTDKLFLEYIKPGLHIELYKNTTLYDRFKTDTDSCLGKYGVMKLLTSTPKSARPSSSSTFPTADQGVYNEFIFYMKRAMYASLQFDGLAIATGKGAGAVMEVVKAETEGMMFYIANKLNKQFWGDGSGRLATVDSASSASTAISIDNRYFGLDSNEYTLAHQWLEDGMYIDIRDSSTGNLEVEDVEISSIADVADGTSTLTMASAQTVTDNSEVFDHDTYASSEAAGTGVPMGLSGLISTANPTVGITATALFQNINRSSNTYAQAQTWAHGSVAITNQAILKAIQKCERYGNISVIIMNDILWRAYYTILEADKTMPNEPAFWGGLTGLSFFGGRNKKIPVIYDEDCPDQTIYFVDDSKIKISAPTKAGMDWLPGDSGHILTRVQGKDEYVANLRWYYNMTTNMPRALGYISGVKHAAS
jgi:hypothetical protein